MSTTDNLRQLIRAKLDIDADRIDENALLSDYDLDSLTIVELLFAIEDEFHVSVPDSAATEVTTLKGLADLLDRLIAEQPGVVAQK